MLVDALVQPVVRADHSLNRPLALWPCAVDKLADPSLVFETRLRVKVGLDEDDLFPGGVDNSKEVTLPLFRLGSLSLIHDWFDNHEVALLELEVDWLLSHETEDLELRDRVDSLEVNKVLLVSLNLVALHLFGDVRLNRIKQASLRVLNVGKGVLEAKLRRRLLSQ